MRKTHTARSSTWRAFRALVAFGLLAGLISVGAGASLADSSGSVTVPTTVGGSDTDSWTGTIPPGTTPTSDCTGKQDNPALSDTHTVTINVPANAYNQVQAKFTFTISWDPESLNDEIITVLDENGNEVASHDGGSPEETVTVFNLAAGTYKVVACPFASPTTQEYNGKLTVEALAIPPPLPPLPTSSNGITFDHANLNDPVRMVGEPDVVIDPKHANFPTDNYGIYVSGPGGSTTQASWFWKSTDHGIQWFQVGCPVKNNCQNGGGDTEITIAQTNRDVFASDLQTLQCNSTFRSYDQGNTFTPGEGCFPETDRQWMGNYDPEGNPAGRRIYLSANNLAFGCYMLVSVDNGVTYEPPDPINNQNGVIGNGPGCIGRFAVDQNNGHIFVPTDEVDDHGTETESDDTPGVTYVSTDGGVTWEKRGASGAVGNFFAPIALDTRGHLWTAWTDTFKTYVSYSLDSGFHWHKPIVVSHPGLAQNDFVWLTVGDPGRVAVVFYGTTDQQRDPSVPSLGGPNALWHAYASISTNALADKPKFTQVQATEHVMHRGPICNGGFPGCLINNSDRSMADFFMVDKDPRGRIFIAYNENSDLSQVAVDTEGHFQYIGKPINATLRLRTGPSLFTSEGSKMLPIPPETHTSADPHRHEPNPPTVTSISQNGNIAGTHDLPPGNWSIDPEGDASFPVVPVKSQNHPALDIREVSAHDDETDLTMKMTMSDLSEPAIAEAASAGGTPTWMVMWWQPRGGFGGPPMDPPYYSHWYMKWRGGDVFECGKVNSIDAPALGAPTPKYLRYDPDPDCTADMSGSVNGNEVTMTAPIADFGGLQLGDKIDHVAGYGLVEHGANTFEDWADQAKTFSYVIGTPPPSGNGDKGEAPPPDLDPFQHEPDGYVEVSLSSNFSNPVRAKLFPNNNTWVASLPFTTETEGGGLSGTVYVRQVLSDNLYTENWDDVEAGRGSLGFTFATSAKKIDKYTYPDKKRESSRKRSQVKYRITVNNTGDTTLDNVQVDDTFTKGGQFISAKSINGVWACSSTGSHSFSCTLEQPLPSNGSATVEIILRTSRTDSFSNKACETDSPAQTMTVGSTVTETPTCDRVVLKQSGGGGGGDSDGRDD